MAYNIDDLRQNQSLPSFLKVDASNVSNGLKRLKSDILGKAKPNSKAQLIEELSNDKLHDLALIIDHLANVSNLEPILKAIEEWSNGLPEA